jgi:hypothetical protein
MKENKLMDNLVLDNLKSKARFCAKNIGAWSDSAEHSNSTKLSLLLGVIKMYHSEQEHALFLEEIGVEKKPKPLTLEEFATYASTPKAIAVEEQVAALARKVDNLQTQVSSLMANSSNNSARGGHADF